MKPLLVSSGEPAGIGPDICLSLGQFAQPIVVMGDKEVLQERAKQLNLKLQCIDYEPKMQAKWGSQRLYVYSIPTSVPVVPGKLNVENAGYVISMLGLAVQECLAGNFSALVTAPLHKAIINEAGIPFSGHTEFLAKECRVSSVVMMLASPLMKVALMTTHIPLNAVPSAITQELIVDHLRTLDFALQRDFGLVKPRILVAGLNPHAGENGYLGREEIELIQPTLKILRDEGINVLGPIPADTLFNPINLQLADAFVAMYHDQGLTVLKYTSFSEAVNITLGLPIIRTSVDHGTALELAGKGAASPSSLHAAINCALAMAAQRESHAYN